MSGHRGHEKPVGSALKHYGREHLPPHFDGLAQNVGIDAIGTQLHGCQYPAGGVSPMVQQFGGWLHEAMGPPCLDAKFLAHSILPARSREDADAPGKKQSSGMTGACP